MTLKFLWKNINFSVHRKESCFYTKSSPMKNRKSQILTVNLEGQGNKKGL